MSSDFDWWTPEITHIHWDSRTSVQRVLKWIRNVSRNTDDDFRKSATHAELGYSNWTIENAMRDQIRWQRRRCA